MKAAEVGDAARADARPRTATSCSPPRRALRDALRGRRQAARARQRRLGDRRDGRRRRLPRPPQGWPPRPALDLTEDAAILTAIANDIGAEAIFPRQVIAYGRAGDALLALSTSGNSANVIAALGRGAPARARDDRDGRLRRRPGRRRGARRPRVVTRSQHIPRIQEAQASAYHVLRELVELARDRGAPATAPARARARRGDGAGRRLPALRLPARRASSGSAASCCNDERGVCSRSRATATAVERFLDAAAAPRRRRWRAVERVPPDERAADRASAASRSCESARARRAARAGLAGHRDLRRLPRRAVRPRRPPLPLPVHQLHQLRAALHDRARRPLRPAADDDGRLRDVRRAAGAEYEDPLDRRFHAQPNACPDCGPARAARRPRRPSAGRRRDDAVAAAARRAARRARSSRSRASAATTSPAAPTTRRAVATLRARKHREDKPFALMAPDLEAARALVELDAERGGAAARPASGRSCSRRAAPDARGRAPRSRPASPELGVMLPYSPLHHLLLADAGAPLVMTSGNVSDEPIAYRDEDALERLAGIADLFLLHDRPIQTRTDDSVVRAVARRDAPLLLRRSRGYVPARIDAAGRRARAHVLACGAELKNTFCLAKGDARLGRPPHRRPRELRDAALVPRGHRALRAPVRGRARGRRPRPAPRVPVDQVRARARGRRARRRPAPPRAPGRLPGRARRARARRSARSSTAPATAPTGRSGAASCWSATSRGFERAGHLWPVRLPGGERGDPRAVADGVRVARGGARRRAPACRRRSPDAVDPSALAARSRELAAQRRRLAR